MVIEFSVRETAAMIRGKLLESFPGTRFVARSRRSASGTWIGIQWIDGPTETEVERIIERYEGRSIDGEVIDHLEISDRGLLRVRYGVDLVTVVRYYSAEALRHAIEATGIDPQTIGIRRTGELGTAADLECPPNLRRRVYSYLQGVTCPEVVGSA